MSYSEEPCPLCKTVVRSHRDASRSLTRYECPCCGSYEASDFDFTLGQAREPYYLISSFLRRRHERTGRTYKLADREGGQFPQDLVDLPVPEKLDLALLAIADRTTRFGQPSSASLENDWPLAQAADQRELAEFLEFWRQEGAILGDPLDPVALKAQGGPILTGKGWRLVEEIRPSAAGRGQRAFVAMAFTPEMDAAYDQGIEPALRESGWEPIRVDRQQFEEKICDRILADIRRSGLVVVECTGSSPNVYFEAGFAMGLGIPVVWCVHKDDLDAKRVAFDTRQYPHLAWSEAAELKTQLFDRIRALYAHR